jgi:hypothetical protein
LLHANAQTRNRIIQEGKAYKSALFWMKDLIDEGKIKLVYVPTDELVADILTKPMSGGKF